MGIVFFQVLNPCSLSFKYLTPASTEGGQDISITLEEMVFEFSPGLFTTVSNVVTALTGQQKVAVFMSWTFIQTELQHLSPPPPLANPHSNFRPPEPPKCRKNELFTSEHDNDNYVNSVGKDVTVPVQIYFPSNPGKVQNPHPSDMDDREIFWETCPLPGERKSVEASNWSVQCIAEFWIIAGWNIHFMFQGNPATFDGSDVVNIDDKWRW